jgi:hypothetical protein
MRLLVQNLHLALNACERLAVLAYLLYAVTNQLEAAPSQKGHLPVLETDS